MALTNTACKNAKTNPDKAYKLTDEKGLYLLIHRNGSKSFDLITGSMANAKHWLSAFTQKSA
jgi:Arm DNA-binding domain